MRWHVRRVFHDVFYICLIDTQFSFVLEICFIECFTAVRTDEKKTNWTTVG